MPKNFGLQWTAENLDTCPQVEAIRPGETENAIVSFRRRLNSERLAGTPTVEASIESGDESELNELSLTDAEVVALRVKVNDIYVDSNYAVSFKAVLSSEATPGTIFRLKVTVTSDAPEPQTHVEDMLLRVI